MPIYHPMPAEESGQHKVHATVPVPTFARFRRTFPKHGAVQWAIRMALEVLPTMVDRDEAYKEIFAAEMEKMFADDKRSRSATKYLSDDDRQLGIFPTPLAMPLATPIEHDSNYEDDDDGN